MRIVVIDNLVSKHEGTSFSSVFTPGSQHEQADRWRFQHAVFDFAVGMVKNEAVAPAWSYHKWQFQYSNPLTCLAGLQRSLGQNLL